MIAAMHSGLRLITSLMRVNAIVPPEGVIHACIAKGRVDISSI